MSKLRRRSQRISASDVSEETSSLKDDTTSTSGSNATMPTRRHHQQRNSRATAKISAIDRIDGEISTELKSLQRLIQKELYPQSQQRSKYQQKFNEVVCDKKAAARSVSGAQKSFVKSCENELETIQRALLLVKSLKGKKAEKRVRRNMTDKNAQNGTTPIRRGALMMQLRLAAEALTLWVQRPSSSDEAPPLCGAMPMEDGYICSVGEMVCAKTKSDRETEDEDESPWILAEIGSYADGKYFVIDIDPEQNSSFTLPRKKVIPLPHYRANPLTNPEALFRMNSQVLALYPQTTCFYRGVVKLPPATANDCYQIAFEDEKYDIGYSPPMPVTQKFVCREK